MLRLVCNMFICSIWRIESPKIFIFSSTFSSFVNHTMYSGIKYKMEAYAVMPVNLKINSFMHATENHMAENKQTNKYHIRLREHFLMTLSQLGGWVVWKCSIYGDNDDKWLGGGDLLFFDDKRWLILTLKKL